MHPSSIPKSANQDTFESGARAMTEAVNAGGISAYFADSADPLHAAFKAKAVIHSGPGGMPLMGEAAQKRLSELWEEPRSGKGLAYFHVPFCETRCLYCLFYQNPFKEDASREYARRLIREIELWSDRAAQNSGLIHAVYFGGGTPTALLSEDLKAVLKAVHEHLPLANDCEITLEGRIHHFEDAKMEAALAGGGMNPVSLVAKNIVFTTLLIVLLTKIPKAGTLLLFTAVSMIVSICLMGGSLTLLPAALLGALVGELFVKLTGGAATAWAPWVAAGMFDVTGKGASLIVSYLFLRESPQLMSVIIPIVLLGYAGSLAGLWFGWKTVGELRHAGFVR